MSSSFVSFKKSHRDFFDKIESACGRKYSDLFTVAANKSGKYDVVLKSNLSMSNKEAAGTSRKIIGNLAYKIGELLKTGHTEFTAADGSLKTVDFTEDERFKFIVVKILYAMRCSNFHGNVASRLNSDYANKETYKEFKFIFLLTHTILAAALYMNGYISNDVLNEIKENENLVSV